MTLADAVNKAVETTQTATSDAAPVKDTAAQATDKGTEGTKTEQAPTLFFHKKEKPEAVDLSTLDPTKIPADVLPFYKGMQGDYTRKTQALAEERKKLEGEMAAIGETRKMLETFLSTVAHGKTDAPAPAAAPDLMEEIKALRENGEHGLADQKLMEFWKEQQQLATEPLRKDAEVKNLQATFRETATATMMNDPLVKQYGEYVVKTFDSDNPIMNRLRKDVLSSPERVKFYTPMIMRMLGYEAHIQNLENALETRVESLVAERIKAERAKAAGLPAKLVSSGATTKENAKPKMSLKESLNAAVDTLTSQ
jgi:hypothetical protein